MKTHQDLEIQSSKNSDQDLIDQIISFSRDTKNWSFLEKRSQSYSRNLQEPACIIDYKDPSNKERIGFSFASQNSKTGIYLTNIVPKNTRLSKDQYNSYASNFAQAFREFSSQKDYSNNIKIGKESLELKDIIKAPKTRDFFKSYLNLYPTSYHPNDIERLDIFICALFRFNAKINLRDLESYLVKDLEWDEKDADWCISRISAGLKILEVNQKF